MTQVDAWLVEQPPETRAAIDALRAIVHGAAPGLDETVKWNAPSFADGAGDRVTLGVERRGGVRLVLHRGAGTKDDGFRFDDPAEVAKWPSPDRGVATFPDAAAVEAKSVALGDLITRWIAATRQA